ncbi:MAG: hypothetical protein J6X55_11740 [Victivallales bacterium]|nr:hypothetical protein [Victivallales bacterium]
MKKKQKNAFFFHFALELCESKYKLNALQQNEPWAQCLYEKWGQGEFQDHGHGEIQPLVKEK